VLSGPILSHSSLSYPSLPISLLHGLIQAALLGLSVVALIALWNHAPKAAFAVFLAWTVVIYIAMFAFASREQPSRSILAVVYSRFKNESEPPRLLPSPTRDDSPSVPNPSPYVHQPPYRIASTAIDAMSHLSPRSIETSDFDEDVDDDTRQRIMEEELGRRDVSIVTVPKRKLWIANPS